MAEARLWFVHPQEGDLVISCLNEGIEDIMDLVGIRQEINTQNSQNTHYYRALTTVFSGL